MIIDGRYNNSFRAKYLRLRLLHYKFVLWEYYVSTLLAYFFYCIETIVRSMYMIV